MKNYIYTYLPFVLAFTIIFLFFYFYSKLYKINYLIIVFIILFNFKLPLNVIFYSLNYSWISCITILFTIPLIITFNQLYNNDLPNKKQIICSLTIAIIFISLVRIFYSLIDSQIIVDIITLYLLPFCIEIINHPEGFIEIKHNPNKLNFFSEGSRDNPININESSVNSSSENLVENRTYIRPQNLNPPRNENPYSVPGPGPGRGRFYPGMHINIEWVRQRDGTLTQSRILGMLVYDWRNVLPDPPIHPYRDGEFADVCFEHNMLYNRSSRQDHLCGDKTSSSYYLRMFNLRWNGDQNMPKNRYFERYYQEYWSKNLPYSFTNWILDTIYLEDILCSLERHTMERINSRIYHSDNYQLHKDIDIKTLWLYNHFIDRANKHKQDMPLGRTYPQDTMIHYAFLCKDNWGNRLKQVSLNLRDRNMVRNDLEVIETDYSYQYNENGINLGVNTLTLFDSNQTRAISRYSINRNTFINNNRPDLNIVQWNNADIFRTNVTRQRWNQISNNEPNIDNGRLVNRERVNNRSNITENNNDR